MNPFLDDWLDGQTTKVLKSKRACLRFLRTAYSRCVSDFANKVRTDVTMADGGFRFHVGTPLPDLRQITSWMITHAPKQRTLARLIPALWKRHGREDVSVAGMLLANIEPNVLGQDPWMAFIHLLQRREPLLVVLEVAEELVRRPRRPRRRMAVGSGGAEHSLAPILRVVSFIEAHVGGLPTVGPTCPEGR